MHKLVLPVVLLWADMDPVMSTCVFDNFCPSGVIYPDNVVEEADGFTCKDIASGISYGMIPEEACAQLIFGEIFCCPEEDQPSCFLCGAGGVSYNADKNFDGTNCGDLNTKMKLNPRQKSCSAWTEYYTTKGDVNVRSLCECDGAQPVNQCNICGNGEIFAEAMVPDEGMTCGELIEYSKHVVSAERCSSISTREIKNVCCGGSRAALSMTLLGVSVLFGVVAFIFAA